MDSDLVYLGEEKLFSDTKISSGNDDDDDDNSSDSSESSEE